MSYIPALAPSPFKRLRYVRIITDVVIPSQINVRLGHYFISMLYETMRNTHIGVLNSQKLRFWEMPCLSYYKLWRSQMR